ncbi:MAG: hypothetical protein ACPGSC_12865 [Granulosicoccaceae bacterium]
MADTLILIVGFFCAGVVTFLCAIEYSPVLQRFSFTTGIQKLLDRGPHLHAMVLGVVVAGALASSIVSNTFSQNPEFAHGSDNVPAVGALVSPTN